MFEKVNQFHPDKVADRIAGAIVDLAYTRAEGGWLESNPRIAVEVLIGHGNCYTIIETSLTRSELACADVDRIVHRIGGSTLESFVTIAEQDVHLGRNQQGAIRCGDNGIFRGCPVTREQEKLTVIARRLTRDFPYDGKYILNDYNLIVCQSHVRGDGTQHVADLLAYDYGLGVTINPLGEWTGGTDTDSGATNRKLGSDMGDAVTGGGLHGKDLSKADVSVNIWCHLQAQKTGKPVSACCAIGDESVNGTPYKTIVETAREYIISIGGFEKFAEWGLIC